jgi:hypothetical protein
LDWRAKVELFEEIRREYEFGIGTIAGVAKKLKVHRRMVREAIGSALPVPRKKTERPRWDFAAAVIPGWHATIFPPCFVAGAIFSGMAMVLTLMIVARTVMNLQNYITVRLSK